LIRQVIEVEGDSLDVNARDVFDHDPDLYTKMVRYPLEVLAIFDLVLMNMVSRLKPMSEKHIQTRIYNLKSSTSMRNLNPSGELLFHHSKLCLIVGNWADITLRWHFFCRYWEDGVIERNDYKV